MAVLQVLLDPKGGLNPNPQGRAEKDNYFWYIAFRVSELRVFGED